MIMKANLSAGLGKSHVGEYILLLYLPISFIIFSCECFFRMIFTHSAL